MPEPVPDIVRRILDEVDSRIAAGRPPVVGFDIFDTVITRTYPKEQSLELMCRAIACDLLGDATRFGEVLAAYEDVYTASARANAEAGLDHEALTDPLMDGWCARLGELGATADRAALEGCIAEFETTLMRTIPATLGLMDALAARGVRMVFVSDMYLGHGLVARILDRLGLGARFAAGFVSSDHALLKRTGNLFPHVLTALGIGAEDLVFLGDDALADSQMPARHGITAFHYHLAALEAARSDHRALFEAGATDRAALVRAVLRAAAGPAFDLDTAEAFSVAKYLGPYFGSFALAVQEAYRGGDYGQALFAAREGLLLMRLTDRFDRWAGGAPVAKVYFPASRLTALAFSLADAPFGMTEADNLVRNGQPTLRTLVSFLALDEDALQDLSDAAGLNGPDVPLHPDRAAWAPMHRLIDEIGRRPELAAVRAEGEMFARWMAQNGILDGRRKLFVDLGWSGQIQDSLARGFERRGIPVALDGIYSGMRLEAHWRRRPGCDLLWYHADECSDDTLSKAPLWFPQVLETVCRAPHGTVTGFDRAAPDAAVTVRLKADRDPREVADDPLIARLHQLLEAYCARLALLAAAYGITAAELRGPANLAAFRFLMCPEAEVARLFAGFCNVSDLGSTEVFAYAGGQGDIADDAEAFRPLEAATLWPTGAAASFFGDAGAWTCAERHLAQRAAAGGLKREGGLVKFNAVGPLNADRAECETPVAAEPAAQQAWAARVAGLRRAGAALAADHARGELRYRTAPGTPEVTGDEAAALTAMVGRALQPPAPPRRRAMLLAHLPRPALARGAEARRLAEEKRAAEALALERFDAMREMDAMIAERDRTIAAQERMCLERWDAMQEMGRFIHERDQRIAALEGALAALRERSREDAV